MADERIPSELIAKLNDVSMLLDALKSGDFAKIVAGKGGVSPLAGCDYLCDCNHSYCGCRGSVSKQDFDMVSFPEFMKLREVRLAELKQQIESLDVPNTIR